MRCKPILSVAIVFLVTACGFDPSQVPVPGANVSGPTYQVHIELAHALNLPAQAKVVANGAHIGTLREVRVVDPAPEQPGRVEAIVAISDSVQLPVDTTVQLRQNTILGDIFIGLNTPATGFGKTIPPGGTIPLAQTRPALQIEDLLAGMSTFVGGGAVQQLQDMIIRLNRVLPEQPAETARIFDVLGRDVEDVAGNLDSVDRFLDAIEKDLAAVLDNPRELGELLSARGAIEIPADAKSLVLTLGVIGGLGIVGHAVEWLGPLLEASDAAAKALVPLLYSNRPLDLTAPSNLHSLVALIRDKIIPFVQRGPKVAIGRIEVEGAPAVAADEQVAAIINTLRMIGVVR
ncbi:MlaD family protein [Nocardia sp. XZ_19_385]|uniref:MlaD family protein n=1 Tax=Nocardia sp. XZ_19_385 TaxID=2769488 RepID=UPI00188F1C66|nr:MlaD family protein [Nocardia sp. XZ_19_385]